MPKQSLNLISLPPGLIAQNRAIIGGMTLGASRKQVSGTLRHGHCAVWATITPGIGGRIDLSFEMAMPSVTAVAFDQLRKSLQSALRGGDVRERAVARQAGLWPDPPPRPQSVMAAYAAHLYADLFFDGRVDTETDRAFDANDGRRGPETQAVFAVRGSHVDLLQLAGTLHVEAALEGAKTQVYVPVTVIDYDDGVIIPFAGYAETAFVDTAPVLLQVPMSAAHWA